MWRPKAILIDLDGTITDHGNIDKAINKKNFNNNRLVMFITRLAWFINQFDYLSNTENKWIILMHIYCFCTGRNYIEEKERYRSCYVNDSNVEVKAQYYKSLIALEKHGYKIFIISNNPCSKGIDISYSNMSLITTKNKANEVARLKESYKIKCFLGNNYRDDIRAARKGGTLPFYIGKSKLVMWLLKEEKTASCLTMAIEQIILSDDL